MKYPFLTILTPYVLGIIISSKIKLDLYLIFIFILLSIYLYYTTINKKLNQIIIILIICTMLGMINASDDNLSSLEKLEGDPHTYQGKIIKEEKLGKYIVEISRGDQYLLDEKILLNIYDLREDSDVKIGDIIKFTGKLKSPVENTNPRLFNYKNYLKSKKIYMTSSISHRELIPLDSEINSLDRIKLGFNNLVKTTFSRYLSEENSRLMTGIILGKSSLIDPEDKVAYNDLGLAHILAVSGLHLGIISSSLIFLMEKLKFDKRLNYIITIIFIWIYAYLISFPASVLRASLTLTFLYISRILYKPYNSINILSMTMFILLIINPFFIYNTGFIFSFAASYSLVLFMERIRIALKSKFGNNKFILDALAAILAVQVGLLPIEIYYFNKIKILGPIANLLLVPLISLSLMIAFSMILVELIFSPFNPILAIIINSILEVESLLLKFINQFSYLNIKMASPSMFSIILYYLFILVVFNFRKIKKIDIYKIKIVNFLLVLLIISTSLNMYLNDDVEIHFIDVGQGDCALIRSGGQNILIDTGGDIMEGQNVGKNITLPYLEKLGIGKIDKLFISHFHTDHYQAIFDLADEIKIERIYASYMPEDEDLIRLILEKQVDFKILKAGDSLDLDKNIRLLNIWPGDGELAQLGDNNMSMCSYLKIHGTSLLFSGDIEEEAEKKISDSIGDLNLDILKVPHHGSKTSSTQVFISKVDPKNAVVSVGRNNMFNHPSEEVIERYKLNGTKTYRTDRDGMVYFNINKTSYEIIPYMDENREIASIMDIILENPLEIIFYLVYFMILYILVKEKASRGEDLFALQWTNSGNRR